MATKYREPDSENPFSWLFNEVLQSFMRELFVCLPGRVTGYDPATQLAQVECGIQRIYNGTPRSISAIDNVPVQFPGNNGWYMFHEITPGETEGLIVFSQRAVDTWINSGGVSAPVDFRMFDQNDGFFLPGFRSIPGSVPDMPNEGAGMSSYDGGTRIHLTDGQTQMKAGGSTMTINSSGFNVNAPSFTHNGVNVGETHRHSGVDTGSGTSGGPV